MKIKCLGYNYTIKNNKVTKVEHIKKPKKKIESKADFEKLVIFAYGKDYKHFLKTAYWRQICKVILKRDKYKCSKCESKRKLQVHHKTYKNHFHEHEHTEDLTTLCEKCHSEIHCS